MAFVKFNKDTLIFDKTVRDDITNMDFHVPGGDALAPRATPQLDGSSSECHVSYRDVKGSPTEIFKVTQGVEFPDYVQVTIRGPVEENKKHVVKAHAIGANKEAFDAMWTRQDEL